MVQTLGVEEEKGVLVQFCAEDLYLYTELSYEEGIKQISSWGSSKHNKHRFLVIFAGVALKLEKVGPTFSSVSLWLAMILTIFSNRAQEIASISA